MESNTDLNAKVEFDDFLPERYRKLSEIHWSPKPVIDVAITWLTERNAKSVLDLGSGVGKFCIIGSQKIDIQFTGVEKREHLHSESIKLANKLKLKHINFVNDDITNIDFSAFDSFYYFNPFCEQVCYADWIDQELDFSQENFDKYQDFVSNSLKKTLPGTCFISYCAVNLELPHDFILHEIMFDGLLQLWIKR